MPELFKPCREDEVEALVRWAIENDKSLEIMGHGSKCAFGCPIETDAILDMSGLAGITLYEPEELVLSAWAGTALVAIEALLASKGQYLAFEPGDYGTLFGQGGRGTIGGVVAANLSGPRRIRAGAARDHLLGVVAVSGRGETFRAGGRVVKNVTGYDLCKLMAGSWGTLGVITEVTLKVLPQPPVEATVLAFGIDEDAAVAVMAKAMGLPCNISAAAHLPEYVAPAFDGLLHTEATTAFRIEGVAPSVAHGISVVTSLLKTARACATLEEPESRTLWRGIRDVRPFCAGALYGERALWRVSTAPSRCHEIVRQISPASQLFYDWAGGLVWIATKLSADCSAGEIRNAVATVGGQATLIRAPDAVRANVGAFMPETGALAALTRRIKEGFDPKGILNPGRMWPEPGGQKAESSV
jgi:glycolate oxidase FAD binding subunit